MWHSFIPRGSAATVGDSTENKAHCSRTTTFFFETFLLTKSRPRSLYVQKRLKGLFE
jgi:hypothetical protein